MPVFVAGLDLGQLQDYTALVVVQCKGAGRMVTYDVREPETRIPMTRSRSIEMMPLIQADVRWVERFPLGTKYLLIEKLLRDRLYRIPQPRYLAIDRTGVGVGVCEMFASLNPIGITFTNGGEATMDGPQQYKVPKRDLIGCAQVLSQNRVLKISEALPHADLLVQELLKFRQKISIGGHDSYEAWRENDHDDLVNALAIACWTAQTIISTQARVMLEGLTEREDPPMISPY